MVCAYCGSETGDQGGRCQSCGAPLPPAPVASAHPAAAENEVRISITTSSPDGTTRSVKVSYEGGPVAAVAPALIMKSLAHPGVEPAAPAPHIHRQRTQAALYSILFAFIAEILEVFAAGKLCSWFWVLAAGITAVAFGHAAWVYVGRDRQRVKGRVMATFGLIFGYFNVLVGIVGLAVKV